MKQDLYRFLIVIIISLIIGIIFGNILLSLVVGLILYFLWHLYLLNKLLLWMKNSKSLEPPNVSGLLNSISIQFSQLRSRNKKRKKKLSKFLKKFRETTQGLPDAVIILGDNNEITWANDKAETYLGINFLINSGENILELVNLPELRDFLESFENNECDLDSSIKITSTIKKDTRLEIRLIPFGKSEKLLVARDITKIFRIDKMRSDFIANASHELRTPLTVISGYLESFEDDFSGPEFHGEHKRIVQMKIQTERMKRLIEDLLNLSSLETSEKIICPEKIRMHELIRLIVDEAESIDGNIKHVFNIDADKSLCLEGNENQIYSAISNIIFNAVQHTPDSGTITIRWYEDEGQGILEVIDTGEGISAEHIPRLTERFFRVDKSRSREKGGTGLGLAIVKHILAVHKSKLEINSKPGEGSVFRIIFPNILIIREKNITKKTAEI